MNRADQGTFLEYKIQLYSAPSARQARISQGECAVSNLNCPKVCCVFRRSENKALNGKRIISGDNILGKAKKNAGCQAGAALWAYWVGENLALLK